eukprot:142654_1
MPSHHIDTARYGYESAVSLTSWSSIMFWNSFAGASPRKGNKSAGFVKTSHGKHAWNFNGIRSRTYKYEQDGFHRHVVPRLCHLDGSMDGLYRYCGVKHGCVSRKKEPTAHETEPTTSKELQRQMNHQTQCLQDQRYRVSYHHKKCCISSSTKR